jgi:capsular exopolysaccharide synthesis family protein
MPRAISVACAFILFAAGSAQSLHAQEYVVGEGDVLKISVYDHPDLETVVRVGGAGAITFPLIGSVKVDGLTVSGVTGALEARLADGYLVNPQVAVFMQEYRSKKTTIMGKVARPGLYELHGQTTFLGLLSKAGGLTPDAGDRAVVKRKPRAGGGDGDVIVIDLKRLIERGDTFLDAAIMDGDSVFVGEAGEFFITGEVMRPDAYKFEEGITLIKAIMTAGGFTDRAARDHVIIVRDQGGEEESIQIWGDSTSFDAPVKRGDSIHVPKAGVFYVTGEVKSAGSYTYEEKTTVLKAITVAGGFTDQAAEGRMRRRCSRRSNSTTRSSPGTSWWCRGASSRMEILDQELHVRDYLRILNKRKITVVAVFWIVAVIAITRTLLATPIFQANTRVIIEKNAPQNISVVNPYYAPWDPDFYNTQGQLIRSAAVGEKIVSMLSLEGKMSPKGVSGGLIVTPVKDSKVVTIAYQSPNPELATLIVNAAVEAYMEELLEMKMSSSRYAINWMTEKAKEEAAKLDKSERELQAYMKANDIITLENRITIVPQRLSELSVELTKAETKRRELETLYEKIRSVSKKGRDMEALPLVESDGTLQALRSQILRAEQNVVELSKKYGEKHPSMIVARGDLEVLKKKRAEEIRRVIESIANEYELAAANEKNLRRRLGDTKQEALNLNEKFIQYEVLKRAADTNRQFYNALMTKTKEQSITEQIQTIDVWVLEKAEVPGAPVKPQKRRSIMMGLILGLLGGIGMAFFVEYLDNTVKSPDEVELKTGVSVLGIVQRLKDKERRIERVVLEEPTSPIGESYKALRTALLLSKAEHPPRSILLTSAIPNEGKTATAVNTAVAMALSGQKVLLIDGDLRRHQIHKVFNVPNVKGLSSYLAGVSDSDIVVETEVNNLSVVTPGPTPPNPSELMSSARMEKLIEEMTGKYDMVIFDSSPILTVSDSLVISRYVDASILVVRSGKTTYDMARRALRMLDDVNATMLGLVLNDFDEKRGGYYYYYRDNYYYQFSQKEGAKTGMRS